MVAEKDVRRSLVVIFGAIALDAMGLGLVFPILPRLLAEVCGPEAARQRLSVYIGLTIAIYAVMQLVFAPVLGALSDRFGRRPVLLVSLGGAIVSYAVMATGHAFSVLLLGRAVAGLTSANVSVATAYITDISPEGTRARRFGLFNAMFGLGFIVGPVLGGVLGDWWLRLPFVVAAVLNAGTLLLAFLLLPESRTPGPSTSRTSFNPIRQVGWAVRVDGLLPLMVIFFIFAASGEAYGTCWALWGTDTFGWTGAGIGLSLGVFGVCQALAQAFAPGPAVARFGERRAILLSIACGVVALVAVAFATRSWVVFAAMPLFALGGIGAPALQTLATRRVSGDEQGRLQGVLASVVSLASIVAPLTFSFVYLLVRERWPGAIWLSVVVLDALVAPIVLRLDFTAKPA
jgi:DHA1 family tetracycline resistance protein-like MFS transporter